MKIKDNLLRVPANGYAFVYVSNNSNIEVWFDNLEISHQRGRILQENHYYPYGLQIASISSKAAGKMDNMYRYQGAYSEFEEETGWNDFELRTYDAQVGRWTGVDAYDQFASGYVGMGNDQVNGIDPNGGVFGPFTDWAFGNHLAWGAVGAIAGGLSNKSNPLLGMAEGFGAGFGLSYVPWNAVGSGLGNAGSWAGSFFQNNAISVINYGLIGIRNNPSYGRGEDFQTAAQLPANRSFYYTDLQDDNSLFNSMSDLFNFYSSGTLNTVGQDMISKFRNGTNGKMYENNSLNKVIQNDSRTKTFIKNFGMQFGEAIAMTKGELNFGTLHFNSSPFYDDKFGGLGITVHGTQGANIYLDKYTFNKRTGAFSAEFRANIFDDFGVSLNDVTIKWYAPKYNGLVAWWILQNRRGYNPYVTKMTASYKFSGKIKM